jgi:TonB-dependent SusC/RagA subfamily outer membrane receptor
VLIDGAVGDINRVNPNDVESISVIKDAAAAAVYGARAAFGVTPGVVRGSPFVSF